MAEKEKHHHAGHRERLRNRFFEANGFSGFSKHNMLELILFYSIPRVDTNELASVLIETFGSLKGVFDASPEELLSVEGVGKNTMLLIRAIREIVREYQNEELSEIQYIDSTEKAVKVLRPKFAALKHETVMMLCLNNSRKLLKCSVIRQGGIDSAFVDMRKITSDILLSNATAVVLAHNHPGGVCAPSKEDLAVTQKMISFLRSIGVRLLDHVIMTEDGYFSFANSAKFKEYFALQPVLCENESSRGYVAAEAEGVFHEEETE